jgi:hypothetical protein
MRECTCPDPDLIVVVEEEGREAAVRPAATPGPLGAAVSSAWPTRRRRSGDE